MRRSSMTLAVPVVAGALALAACAPAGDAAGPSPSAPPTPSETATPTPTAPPYEIPAETDDEISRLVHEGDADPPTTASTVSGVVVADVDFFVSGQCVGESVDFSLLKATPGETAGETLVEGEIDCATGIDSGFSYRTPYDGLVQLSLGDAGDVDRAWVVVRGEPAG